MKNKNIKIFRNPEGKHVIQIDECTHIKCDSYYISGIIIKAFNDKEETFWYCLKEKDTITFESIYTWRN